MPVERRGQVIAIDRVNRHGSARYSMEGGSLRAMARSGCIERFTSGICQRFGVKFPGPTRQLHPSPWAAQ
jgi:hypothetical protein